jgi:hypothetical protein
MTTIATAGKVLAFNVLKVFIGLLAVSFVALIFGQFLAFWAFILIATICTAGVALFAIIPVALAVGSVVLRLGYKIAKKPYPNLIKGSENGEKQSNTTTALISFINQARAHSTTDEEIKKALLRNGWKETDIDQCLSKAAQPTNELPKPL